MFQPRNSHRDPGDQHEDRPEDQALIDGTFKAPPCGGVELSYKNPNCSQGANEAVKPRSATPVALPDFVEPMQAKLVASMPPGTDPTPFLEPQRTQAPQQ